MFLALFEWIKMQTELRTIQVDPNESRFFSIITIYLVGIQYEILDFTDIFWKPTFRMSPFNNSIFHTPRQKTAIYSLIHHSDPQSILFFTHHQQMRTL